MRIWVRTLETVKGEEKPIVKEEEMTVKVGAPLQGLAITRCEFTAEDVTDFDMRALQWFHQSLIYRMSMVGRGGTPGE